MNLTVKRIKGSQFTADDMVRVTLDTDNQSVHNCIHTVEVVSGVEVTHGGGAPSGEWLHYKSYDRDANSDGVIDYSTVEMYLEQTEKGTSTIKIKTQFYLLSEWDTHQEDWNTWNTNRLQAEADGTEFTDAEPTAPDLQKLETGELTLEWSDDTEV